MKDRLIKYIMHKFQHEHYYEIAGITPTDTLKAKCKMYYNFLFIFIIGVFVLEDIDKEVILNRLDQLDDTPNQIQQTENKTEKYVELLPLTLQIKPIQRRIKNTNKIN